jgi:putative acetyltransferase
MESAIKIRPFNIDDAVHVRDLFVRVNRLLAPPQMKQAFEDYIAASLKEEIDQISCYYGGKRGGFWVAVDGGKVVGMFGLEPSSTEAMELRRMYVDPDVRRRGIARKMLSFAEDECRRRNRPRMDLSTSELQSDACRSIEQRISIARTGCHRGTVTLGGRFVVSIANYSELKLRSGHFPDAPGGTQDVSSLRQSGRRCCSACRQIQAGYRPRDGHETRRHHDFGAFWSSALPRLSAGTMAQRHHEQASQSSAPKPTVAGFVTSHYSSHGLFGAIERDGDYGSSAVLKPPRDQPCQHSRRDA